MTSILVYVHGIILLVCLNFVNGQNNCTGLKIFDAQTQSQIETLNCTRFDTIFCKDGPSGFPEGLAEGDSVEAPKGFLPSVFRRNFTAANVKASGISFNWQGPVSATSRKYIKGYYLKLTQVGGGKLICRLFDLRNFSFNISSLKFEWELFPMQNKVVDTYMIDLFSLPPASQDELDSAQHQRHVVTVPPYHIFSDGTVYPADWRSSMSTQLDFTKGTINVTFMYPEEDNLAKFDTYRVGLINENKDPYNFFKEAYVKQADSPGFGRHSFSDIPSGTYTIQVRPNDTHFNIEDRCLCWKTIPNYPHYCGACTAVETKPFNFTRLSDPATSTAAASSQFSTGHSGITTPDTTQPSTGSSDTGLPSWDSVKDDEGNNSDSTGLIVGVLAGAAVILVLCLLAVYVYKRRQGKKGDTNNNSTVRIADIFQSPPVNAFTSPKELQVPQLARKTVVVVSCEDHAVFSQAVERFCRFLDTHCQCHVLFAPTHFKDLRQTTNSYCWLSAQIDRADFVLIVNSEAAYRLYVAFQDGQRYKEADFGPLGDLFTPALQHICGKIALNEDVSKVVMVQFDHTSPSYQLPIAALSARPYRLPLHLPTFLQLVHKLDPATMDLSWVNLPLKGNVEELQGGRDWLNSVTQARSFERDNPDWFARKFGPPLQLSPTILPGYEQQISQESKDSGIDRNSLEFPRRLSSVSSHENKPQPPDLEWDFQRPPTPSIYTVNFSDVTDATRPSEIDAGSSVSQEFRLINAQYDQDRQEERRDWLLENGNIPEESRSAISGQSDPHNPFFKLQDANSDRFSVTTGLSV